jgi:hypothetical protein
LRAGGGRGHIFYADEYVVKVEVKEKFSWANLDGYAPLKFRKYFEKTNKILVPQCDLELLIWKEVQGTKFEKAFLPILDGCCYDEKIGFAYVVQKRLSEDEILHRIGYPSIESIQLLKLACRELGIIDYQVPYSFYYEQENKSKEYIESRKHNTAVVDGKLIIYDYGR